MKQTNLANKTTPQPLRVAFLPGVICRMAAHLLRAGHQVTATTEQLLNR
jgi:hypothetical protein